MKFAGNENFTLHHGDNREVLKELADDSIDAIVTDPPYELGFMGKSWDASGIAYDVAMWREALRVLKPGGHLLAFSGSRTYHRMAVAIEDAGFEIRDQIMWIYGSGFPKSLNVGKSIEAVSKTGKASPKGQREAAMGELYEPTPLAGTANYGVTGNFTNKDTGNPGLEITTPEAKQWQGWGTALKPAHEPIVVARKPLIGTVAANVLTYGTGGLNIDGARVEGKLEGDPNRFAKTDGGWAIAELHKQPVVRSEGRWPANVIHDGSDEVVALFPQGGASGKASGPTLTGESTSNSRGKFSGVEDSPFYGDSGSAARFFYCAKASKRDRNEGLDGFEAKRASGYGYEHGLGNAAEGMFKDRNPIKQNYHPTVKPTALMQYLCKLVTPPGGTVLDPFAGSGSTGKAAIYEGFKFIGIEMTEEYLPIAKARIEYAVNNREDDLFNA